MQVWLVMPDKDALDEQDMFVSRCMMDPRYDATIEANLKRARIRFSYKRMREGRQVMAGHLTTRAVLRGELPLVRKHMVECN